MSADWACLSPVTAQEGLQNLAGAGAVQVLADQVKALKGSGRKVYIHCTAGDGLPGP